MTVRELKELLEEAEDEMMVIIPIQGYYDGRFYSPDYEDCGVVDLDDEREALLLAPYNFIENDNQFELN